jgi:hypothetical protein
MVDPVLQLVRVRVRSRTATMLSRLFGVLEIPVGAQAAAQVLNAAGAKCVKPFALPDIWEEGGLIGTNGQDHNGNKVWEPHLGEQWSFDPAEDHYQKWTGDAGQDATATGYGSALRDGRGSPAFTGDHGRPLVIKAGQPANDNQNEYNTSQIFPGIFFPFEMPGDPEMSGSCGVGGGGGDSGAAAYSSNICGCNNNTIDFETEYPLKPGNMVGPTRSGINALIGNDNTSFEEAAAGVETPRVIKIALYDPGQVAKSGKQSIRFNNIALFYIERMQGNDVIGRFMRYADGVGVGGASLTRVLQLVE